MRPRIASLLELVLPVLTLLAPAGCQFSYAWQPPEGADAALVDADPVGGDASAFADGASLAIDAAILPPDAMVAPPDAPPPPPPPDASTGCGGCPTGISFGTPTTSLQVGGTGGSAFSEACPSGQVVIGYDGGLEPNFGALGSLRAHCGTLAISQSTLAVTVTPAGTLTRRGTVTSPAWTRLCPSNTMVVGFSGHSGALVDQVSFICAPLVISGSSGSYSIGYGNQVTLSAIGDNGGSPFAAQMCANGGVGTGDAGRSGSFVDAYAMVCSRPQLSF